MKEIARLLTGALLTMIIEVVVLYSYKVRDKRLGYSLFINLFTNLLLNSFLSLVPYLWLYILLLIIGEVVVYFIEWYLYELIQKDKKNWLYCLVANLSSFLIGSLLVYFLFLLF